MSPQPNPRSQQDPGSRGGDNLPTTTGDRGDNRAVGQPIDQIARAMQVQVELLKDLHDRQRTLEDAVKDNKRHELVINSARALNDSFKGLQQVQERLSEQLAETRSNGLNRGRFVLLLVAVLILAAVGVGIAMSMREGNDALRTDLREALDPAKRDAEVRTALDKVENRLRSVETQDRESYRQEVDQLRKGLDSLTAERDVLRRERDTAREENGATKASLGALQTASNEQKTRLAELEKDNARLTAQSLSDQRLIGQLNNLIASLKDRATAESAPPVAKVEPKAPVEGPKETPDPKPTNPAGPADAPANAAAKADPTPAKPQSVDPAQLDALNKLLKNHRGSDRYVVTRAESLASGKLQGVTMEVRATDGSLAKVIEADSLACTLSRTDLLELQFEGGTVTFHQGISGRPAKSPFFNNRYQIVVLGVNAEDWIKSNFTFVKSR